MPPHELPPSSPLKRFADRFLPFLYRPLRGALQWWRGRRFRARYGRIVRQVTNRIGWNVQAGPFTHMLYIEESRSSALVPKLLGTYEDELHGVLERLLANSYAAVVDIGCAEGYYAVGLAHRLPGVPVHAFDPDPRARDLCRQLAARNGVAVHIHDAFTPESLRDLPAGRLLVICDVDGYEMNLFHPEQAAAWRQADLIVELHDFMGLPCRDTVRRCLADSHDLELISSRPEAPPGTEALAELAEADRRLAVDEIRPPQDWLIALSRPARADGPA